MSAPENIEKILQEKYARYLSLRQTLEAYQLLYETNRKQLEEILLTISALEAIQRKKIDTFDGFISIGSGVFIRVKGNLSGKVLVGIGANVAVEVGVEEAIYKLKEREKSLRQELSKIQNTINQLAMTMYRLEEEILSLQKYINK